MSNPDRYYLAAEKVMLDGDDEQETLPKDTRLVLNGETLQRSPLQALERLLKKWLYLKCKSVGSSATGEKLSDHKELICRFLLRSTLSRRKRLPRSIPHYRQQSRRGHAQVGLAPRSLLSCQRSRPGKVNFRLQKGA